MADEKEQGSGGYLKGIWTDTKATRKELNENLSKINETLKSQMSGVVKAVNEPPSDVEGDKEKKTENKKFFDSLKKMLKSAGGGMVGAGGGLLEGVGKMMKKYKKIIMGLLGVGLVALFSQLNMKQLKEMWISFKGALVSIYETIAPIALGIWNWGKETLLPTLVDLVIDSFNSVSELFTSIKERFDGWGSMTWKEQIFSVLGVFGDIGKYVFDMVGNILVAAEKLLGGDGTFIKDLWGNIELYFNKMIDWFKLLFTNPAEAMSKLWTGLLEGAASIGNWIFEKALKPLWGWLKEKWSGIKESISAKWVEWFPDGLGTFMVDKVFTPLWGWLKEKFTDISGFIGKKWVEWFPDGLGTFMVDKVWTPFKEWFTTLFDFSTIRTTIESLINLATIIPNTIKKYLLDPAVKWIGDKFGWDTSKFTKFSIGELVMQGWEKIVNWFTEKFDIKWPEINIPSPKELVKMIAPAEDSVLWKVPGTGFIKKWIYNKEPDVEGKRVKGSGIGGMGGIIKPLDLGQLQSDEGFKKGVYKDTEGIKTIGYGFNLERAGAKEALDAAGIKKSLGDLKSGKLQLTKEEADRLMRGEYPHFADAAKRYVGKETWNKLTLDRQKILTNMAYNMGETGLNQFNDLRTALQKGDYEQAGEEMMSSKWAGQVKGRADRLTARMKNTSGNQLAASATEQGNLQARVNGGAGNTTIIKGGDTNSSSDYHIPKSPRNSHVVESHGGSWWNPFD
jgi:GH24 family phage-related lysozyme (muramidase)